MPFGNTVKQLYCILVQHVILDDHISFEFIEL